MRFDRAVYGNAMERGDASLQSVEFPRFPMPLHSACMSESEGMDIEVADPICESGGVSHRARPGMRPALCGCARRFSGDVGAAMRVVEHYRALEASLGAPQASSPRSSPEPEARRHEPEPEPVGYQSSRGSPSPCGSPRGGHEASPGAA